MNEYQTLANNINGVAQNNLASGNEPLTIASRRFLGNANNQWQMDNMNRSDIFKQLMEKFQQDQMKKDTEAGPLDFIGSLASGAGSIYSGFKSRDKAKQQQNQLNQLFGGQ